MNPVGAQSLGQCDTVIDDECNLMLGAYRLQRLGEAGELVLLHVLDAQLERCDRSTAERRPEAIGKFAGDVLRADQVELARLGALGRPEARQVDIIFIHGALISEAG